MELANQMLRPQTERASSWSHTHKTSALRTSLVDLSLSEPALQNQDPRLYQSNLDCHPEEHFLSSVDMYDYNEWSSDSSDDDDEDDGDNGGDDEVEWNAGITDFALFDQDRRRAEESGMAVPQKWSNMLSSQACALDRAVERSQHGLGQSDLSQSPSTGSMPGLTPDGSPHLHDDDTEISSSPNAQSAPISIVPDYLKSVTSSPRNITTTTNPKGSLLECEDEDKEPQLPFYVQPRRTQSSPLVTRYTRPVRPGLRDGRTMSGKEHVWRRPSWDIFTVREDSAAELKAEKGSNASQELQHFYHLEI